MRRYAACAGAERRKNLGELAVARITLKYPFMLSISARLCISDRAVSDEIPLFKLMADRLDVCLP